MIETTRANATITKNTAMVFEIRTRNFDPLWRTVVAQAETAMMFRRRQVESVYVYKDFPTLTCCTEVNPLETL